jgi:serine/threonine-protein kinase
MRFGSYVLKKHIGEGGYANVYLAAGTGGRTVALKVLKDGFVAQKRVRRLFAHEANVHRRLNDDAVVRCYGLKREGKRLAIALEYFPSRSFRAFVSEGRELADVLNVLLQVGMGLSYLHARRIAHLDLKPGNILVNEQGKAKLIDFCLAFRCTWWARFLRRLRRGAVPGSPSYMAPEVIRGAVPDTRADLYSLGVVTYYALTGQLPFQGANTQQILKRHTHSTPLAPTKLNPRIPESLEILIFRLLAKDPERRLPSASLYCEELLRTGELGRREGSLVAQATAPPAP